MKSKNRLFAIAVVCFLLMLAPIYFANSQAPSDTVVGVVPAQTSVQVGKTFVVNITLSNVTSPQYNDMLIVKIFVFKSQKIPMTKRLKNNEPICRCLAIRAHVGKSVR